MFLHLSLHKIRKLNVNIEVFKCHLKTHLFKILTFSFYIYVFDANM